MSDNRAEFEITYAEYHGHDLEALKRRRRDEIYDSIDMTDAYRWWLKARGEEIPKSKPAEPVYDLDTAVRGVLQDELAAIDSLTPEQAKNMLREIAMEFGRVDATITKSQYDSRIDSSKDVPPNGDDYNRLWSATFSPILYGKRTPPDANIAPAN